MPPVHCALEISLAIHIKPGVDQLNSTPKITADVQSNKLKELLGKIKAN